MEVKWSIIKVMKCVWKLKNEDNRAKNDTKREQQSTGSWKMTKSPARTLNP